MATGEVRVTGPMTKEEKQQWDMIRARKEECDREIATVESLLGNDLDEKYLALIRDDLQQEKKIRAMIAKVIPD